MKLLLASSIVLTANLLTSAIAFGQEAEAQAAPEAASVAAAAPVLPGTEEQAVMQSFIASGGAVALDKLNATITPPTGWNVQTNTGSFTVVMTEPAQEGPDFVNDKYRRNITLGVFHSASAIDEQRATSLAAELQDNFSKDSSVTNFKVLEHKFFDYKAKNDGLLVYSSLSIGQWNLMQMHVLVSGTDKQFLMTYTDFADRFTGAKDAGFDAAWNTMATIQVDGLAPTRQEMYMRYAALAGGALLLVLVVLVLRRKAGKKDYASEADQMMDEGDGELSHSMMATLAGKWKLSYDDKSSGNDDDSFFSNAPKTKPTSYVSSF